MNLTIVHKDGTQENLQIRSLKVDEETGRIEYVKTDGGPGSLDLNSVEQCILGKVIPISGGYPDIRSSKA